MTRLELCEALATDYAKRASSLSLKFEEAYQRYFKRCEIRSYENLLHQFTVGNLGQKFKKQQRRNDVEYIETKSDDDCEDGVCKL
jgi:hypothetical protein|tara:strand:+ start:2360 stop:2614 length:255 start_codon:yes stop_codon:yes gene_type:complete